VSALRARLVSELEAIPGLEDRPSPVTGGSALFYYGKEFAHFHNNNELDVKLTRKIISEEGLTHPTDSETHPNRSTGSQWIELRFSRSADIDEVVRLVNLAIGQMKSTKTNKR